MNNLTYSIISCTTCGFIRANQLTDSKGAQEEYDRMHKCTPKEYKKEQAFVNVAVKIREFF